MHLKGQQANATKTTLYSLGFIANDYDRVYRYILAAILLCVFNPCASGVAGCS